VDNTLTCAACGLDRPSTAMRPGIFLPDVVAEQIQKNHPEWTPEEAVCDECVRDGKADVAQEMLAEEAGELSPLEAEVVESIRTDSFVAINENEADENPGTKEHFSHRIIAIIGNWYFPLAIAIFLTGWLLFNILLRPFSPYPMIVLGVISALLASLAALQAPIIIMSQRDQQKRDRLRADNEYRVNLKAEMEIRYLDEKVEKMMEMQQQIMGETGYKKDENA
jgi:uncharacterized membrane protein